MTQLEIQGWADELESSLPQGTELTRDQLIALTSIPDVGAFHVAKGVLQDRLSGGDTTLVGDSRTALYGGWTYSLQSKPDAAASKSYQIRKYRNLFGRVRRFYIVVAVLARGEGRTAAGRMAQRLGRDLYAMMENIADALVDLGAKAPVLPPR